MSHMGEKFYRVILVMKYVPEDIREDIVEMSRRNQGEYLGKERIGEERNIYLEFKDKREGLSFCGEVREKYGNNVIRIDHYYDWRYD